VGSRLIQKSPGLRPTSMPNGILMHAAVWPQYKLAENWGRGYVPFFGKVPRSPYSTMWPGLRPTSMSSAILIHPAIWPQEITTTTTVLWPFFRNHLGKPVPEENFWTLWCKGRLTEADTPTLRLGATSSGLSSAHLHFL